MRATGDRPLVISVANAVAIVRTGVGEDVRVHQGCPSAGNRGPGSVEIVVGHDEVSMGAARQHQRRVWGGSECGGIDDLDAFPGKYHNPVSAGVSDVPTVDVDVLAACPNAEARPVGAGNKRGVDVR